jgi:hypothetical protein
MATPTQAPIPQPSSIPIFIARLDQLKAIASGLRELPQSRLDELQSLLDRAYELVKNATRRPIAPENESAPES